MEANYYSLKLGLTSQIELQEFYTLFHNIFNNKSDLPTDCLITDHHRLANFGPLSSSSLNAETFCFQEVFRKYFQRSQSAYIVDFAAVSAEADAEFEESMKVKLASYDWAPHLMSSEDRQTKQVLRPKLALWKLWLRKVNELRREGFRRGAQREAERSFKVKLSNRFPVHYVFHNFHFYEEQEIVEFGQELLEGKIVKDFLARFPSFEKEKEGWAAELRKACSLEINQTLERNKLVREDWERGFSEAISSYKGRMTTLLEQQHPLLVRGQRLRLYHEKAKKEAEMNRPLLLVCKPSVWNAKAEEEFRLFEDKWKREREDIIGLVLNGVRALARDLDRVNESMSRRGLNQSTPKPGPACSKRLSGTTAAGDEACKRAKL